MQLHVSPNIFWSLDQHNPSTIVLIHWKSSSADLQHLATHTKTMNDSTTGNCNNVYVLFNCLFKSFCRNLLMNFKLKRCNPDELTNPQNQSCNANICYYTKGMSSTASQSTATVPAFGCQSNWIIPGIRHGANYIFCRRQHLTLYGHNRIFQDSRWEIAWRQFSHWQKQNHPIWTSKISGLFLQKPNYPKSWELLWSGIQKDCVPVRAIKGNTKRYW